MASEPSTIKMATPTKASMPKAGSMGKESFCWPLAPAIRESFSRAARMGRESGVQQTVNSMTANISMTRNTDKADINGRMDVSTRDILNMTNSSSLLMQKREGNARVRERP